VVVQLFLMFINVLMWLLTYRLAMSTLHTSVYTSLLRAYVAGRAQEVEARDRDETKTLNSERDVSTS